MEHTLYQQTIVHVERVTIDEPYIFNITKHILKYYITVEQFNQVLNDYHIPTNDIGELLCCLTDVPLHEAFGLEKSWLLESLKNDVFSEKLKLNNKLVVDGSLYSFDDGCLDTLLVTDDISFLLTFMPEIVDAPKNEIDIIRNIMIEFKTSKIVVNNQQLKDMIECGSYKNYLIEHNITH